MFIIALNKSNRQVIHKDKMFAMTENLKKAAEPALESPQVPKNIS